MKKIFVVIGSVILLVLCAKGIEHIENYEEIYYSKINNTKVEKLSSNSDMKYEYTLDCYNKEGKKKELKFKTSRELKENHYILLETRTLGVHKWEEVQYEDLSKKVKEKLK